MRHSEDLSEDQKKDLPEDRAGGTSTPKDGSTPNGPTVEIGSARCERVCEVFVESLAALSWPRGPVRDRTERQALCDGINANLRADGTINGMLAELRRAVGEWVAAYATSPQFTSGWSAKRFAAWLAEGRLSSAARAADRPSGFRPGPTYVPHELPEPVMPAAHERMSLAEVAALKKQHKIGGAA